MSATRNHAIARQDERIMRTLASLNSANDPAELDKLTAALNSQLKIRNALVNTGGAA